MNESLKYKELANKNCRWICFRYSIWACTCTSQLHNVHKLIHDIRRSQRIKGQVHKVLGITKYSWTCCLQKFILCMHVDIKAAFVLNMHKILNNISRPLMIFKKITKFKKIKYNAKKLRQHHFCMTHLTLKYNRQHKRHWFVLYFSNTLNLVNILSKSITSLFWNYKCNIIQYTH